MELGEEVEEGAVCCSRVQSKRYVVGSADCCGGDYCNLTVHFAASQLFILLSRG